MPICCYLEGLGDSKQGKGETGKVFPTFHQMLKLESICCPLLADTGIALAAARGRRSTSPWLLNGCLPIEGMSVLGVPQTGRPMGKRSRALSVALMERPLAGRREKPPLLEAGRLAGWKVGLSSHPKMQANRSRLTPFPQQQQPDKGAC